MDTAYSTVMSVYASDNPDEVFDAYRLIAPLTILRLASYSEKAWPENEPMVQDLASSTNITILDFGCGLAQRSRALATRLKQAGHTVRLQLADIPTMKHDFLKFIARETAIDIDLLDCMEQAPIPELAPCHVCFAEEFLEHVHDPLQYIRAFDSALLPGGFLITNVADHEKEYMHVHHDLRDVREYLAARQFRELRPFTLFQKIRKENRS